MSKFYILVSEYTTIKIHLFVKHMLFFGFGKKGYGILQGSLCDDRDQTAEDPLLL